MKHLWSTGLRIYVMAAIPPSPPPPPPKKNLLTLKYNNTVLYFFLPLHEDQIYKSLVNLKSIYRCYCNNNIVRLTTFTVLQKCTKKAQNTTPSGMQPT